MNRLLFCDGVGLGEADASLDESLLGDALLEGLLLVVGDGLLVVGEALLVPLVVP